MRHEVCKLGTWIAVAALQLAPAAIAQPSADSTTRPASSSQVAAGTPAERAQRERTLDARLTDAPTDADAWREFITIALDDGRSAIAAQRFRRAAQYVKPTPEMHYLAARAYAAQGAWLGKAELRTIPDGRVGQVAGDWLAIEKTDGLDRFRCVPADSTLFHIRRALDSGLDQPDAFVLHARAWLIAGRADAAWQIIESQQTRIAESSDDHNLAVAVEIAIAADRFAEALRFARVRGERSPERREQILFDAYVTCADRCGLAGDDALYRDLLGRAAELRPKDTAIALRIADAEYEAGNRDRAQEWYRRVIDVAPDHPARVRVLQRLSE